MFLVDFETELIVPDDEIKEHVASQLPYKEWVQDNMMDLETWTADSGVIRPKMDFTNTNRKLNMFGFSLEKLEMLLLPMAVGGKEALGSMGNDAALAVLSEKPRQVNDYFKQLFAQVTNPPIDPIREEIVMSLVCPVGPEQNLLAPNSPQHCERLVVRHPILTLEEMQTLKNKQYLRKDGTTAFATQDTWTTLLVGLAASVGAGISMGFTEVASDDGVISGRGSPMIRGVVTGIMTTVGGLGHALPYLIPDFWLATYTAFAVVALELFVITWIQHKYMETPWMKAMMQIILGGALVLGAGILIGQGWN